MPDSDQNNAPLCVIGEPDPFLARLLQRYAEKSGLQVRIARTGEDLLELALHSTALLIILDPELPGKVRGWETVSRLKADSQTPILLCSWLKKPEALALVGEPLPYLQKPELSYEDFLEALKACAVKLPDQPNSSSL